MSQTPEEQKEQDGHEDSLWWDEDSEELELDDNCPNCGKEYDEIDKEFQICHLCGFNNNHKCEKRVQDIRLKDGREIIKCYPNAGKWCCLSDNKVKDIPDSEVTHTRLTNDPDCNEEVEWRYAV
jgi:hypothetical protein